MFNMANICIFEGRLSRDPQYSSFNGQNGPVKKALFSIAVDRAMSSAQRQQAQNNNGKTADFIPCSLIGEQVDFLQKYFSKGKAIRVVGHYQEYQTKDQQTGETKYGHTFEIDKVGFCVQDPKGQQDQNQGGYNNQQNGGGYPQQQYQQPPQQQYPQQQQYQQQPPMQQPQQQAQGFSMFDESNSPF